MAENKFKKPKKNFRKRKDSTSSEESDKEGNGDDMSTVETLKFKQSLRKRQHGVSAEGLAVGKEDKEKEFQVKGDGYSVKTGGMVDMNALKQGNLDLEADEAIGTTFAAETNSRDEDAEMLKYVEVELRKRKGMNVDGEDKSSQPKKVAMDDALFDVPEHLRSATAKQSEDMLSNQMLSGIPEVDLGIEAKIKNIESTENSKMKMIEERKRARERISEFVPTNMAVNFVQHNRFNIEDSTPILKKEDQKPAVQPRVGDFEKLNEKGGAKKKDGEKATDDYHYEKFKKQMRRF